MLLPLRNSFAKIAQSGRFPFDFLCSILQLGQQIPLFLEQLCLAGTQPILLLGYAALGTGRLQLILAPALFLNFLRHVGKPGSGLFRP